MNICNNCKEPIIGNYCSNLSYILGYWVFGILVAFIAIFIDIVVK
jgi:hypothetical protein